MQKFLFFNTNRHLNYGVVNRVVTGCLFREHDANHVFKSRTLFKKVKQFKKMSLKKSLRN